MFDLTISIKGNNLIIQGKLKHIDSYGNSSLYHSTKNVFILSPETKYWQSDMTVSKEKFLGMAQQAIGKQWPWFILDMKDGKVASVGFTER